MARLTRHELKKDELGTRLSTLMDVFVAQRRNITLGVLVGVVAVGLGLGIFFFVRSRQVRAADAFAKALSTFHAPVAAAPPQGSNVPTYKTDAEKYQKAQAEFADVAQQYSSYAAGRMAQYYAAICQRELGKFSEAEQQFTALAQGGDANLAALAKVGLASIYEQTNRGGEAETIYRELEDNPTSTVPKVTAQIARADLYHKTNRSEAASLYEQIEKEHAGSSAGDYAGQRLLQSSR
jgi:predicted negative regulator of RcsB-dependent stress response